MTVIGRTKNRKTPETNRVGRSRSVDSKVDCDFTTGEINVGDWRLRLKRLSREKSRLATLLSVESI